MELHALRTFVAVAETGNMTRAAARLFTTQPAVSAQIKQLELQLGVTLFDRRPNGVELTEHGRKLLDPARQTLSQARGVEQMAARLREGQAGHLRVGLHDPGPSFQLHKLCAALLDEWPDLVMEFHNSNSGDVVEKLLSFDLDVGFFEGAIEHDRLHARTIGSHEVCVILPSIWAEAIHHNDFAVLAEYPWVFMSPTCSHYRVLRSLEERHNVTFRTRFRSDSDPNSVELVRAGLAVTIADAVSAERAAATGDVVIWPDFAVSLPIHVATLARRAEEPLIACFLDTVADHAHAFVGAT